MVARPAVTARSSLESLRPLTPAEERIIADLAVGEFDRLGDGLRPESDDRSREVRASFLRFLILGGDEGHRPHEKGVRVSGGWISGLLDLEGARIPRDIGLTDCRFDAVPVLRYAVIDNLFLSRPESVETKDLAQNLCFRRHRPPLNVAVDICSSADIC